MSDRWEGNPYYSPEKCGLKLVADLDRDAESYSFDILAVWCDVASGKFYWCADAGCSCPVPFEDVGRLEDLTELKSPDDAEFLSWTRNNNRNGSPPFADTPLFVAQVREAMASCLPTRDGGQP